MLGLFGIGYITDSISAAMDARVRDETYRNYETDALYYIAEAVGVKLKYRYYDIMHPAKVDSRKGEDIAVERLERFGIKVVE